MWASLQWKQMSRTVGILIPNIKNQTLRNIKFIFGYAEFEWWKVVWFVLYSVTILILVQNLDFLSGIQMPLEICTIQQLETTFYCLNTVSKIRSLLYLGHDWILACPLLLSWAEYQAASVYRRMFLRTKFCTSLLFRSSQNML